MNQKVQLLLDVSLFDKNDKKLIIKLMEIRNQLMHNPNAKSLESCLSFLDGTKNYILKIYLKNKKESLESGGEKARKAMENEELNDKELQYFDISDEEKILYKSLNSLIADVIRSFDEALEKIKKHRVRLKTTHGKFVSINFNTNE